jgi:UDP-N-acetylmuramyl pentapeptide phosphotransferase/UDP-N-acetylglucosamine-1-phosphate transferase
MGDAPTPLALGLTAGAAGLLSYCIVLVVQHQGWRLGLMDVPNDRSLHTQPKPRGGGLGIVVSTLAGILLFRAVAPSVLTWPVWITLLAGGSGIAVVSLVDDVVGVPALPRLVAHVSAAVFAVWLVGPIESLYLPGWGRLALGPVAAVLSIIWVAGLTNAFNFMDGIDGLAAGQAIVAAIGWGAIGWVLGLADLLVIGVLLAASGGGFLLHNWSPARVFMGDVGSAFLGYVLAVLTLIAGERTPALATAGVLLVWPFVFDPALTMVRRVLRRENLLVAHRSHLYQRLVATGCSHSLVALGYIGLAVVAGTLGVLFARTPMQAEALTIGVLPLSVVATYAFVVWRERTPARESS